MKPKLTLHLFLQAIKPKLTRRFCFVASLPVPRPLRLLICLAGSQLDASPAKDRAHCFYCFLLIEKKDAGYDAFVVNG
jgi:hypothetical protein